MEQNSSKKSEETTVSLATLSTGFPLREDFMSFSSSIPERHLPVHFLKISAQFWGIVMSALVDLLQFGIAKCCSTRHGLADVGGNIVERSRIQLCQY